MPERIVFPCHRLDFILGVGGVCRRFQKLLRRVHQGNDFPVFFRQRQQERFQVFLQRHNPARIRFGVLRLDLDKAFLQVNVLPIQPRNFRVAQADESTNDNHGQNPVIGGGNQSAHFVVGIGGDLTQLARRVVLDAFQPVRAFVEIISQRLKKPMTSR
jgi:hypothetical protein